MLHVKSRFGTGAIVAAASAAVTLAAAGVAMASTSGPTITTATTIRLVAHGGSFTFVNIRGQTGPATGDEFIVSQPVFSAAHPAQLAGHLYVTSIIFGRNVAQQAHATLVLKQGEVDMAGVGTSNPFQFAVTGGTGRFQNARGESTTKLLPGKGHPAMITLSLLP